MATEPLLKRSPSSPSSISTVMSNCDELSVLSSSTHPPCKRVHVQQTVLILIHLHLLRFLFKRALEHEKIPLRFNPQLDGLKRVLPAFFGQAGYVSNYFLDSSFQAVNVYFQLHTFHADLHDIPKLISLASFFEADLQSVFLDVYGTLEIEKCLNYSGIITGLSIKLRESSDLEFLNNSSSLFPRLKQLEIEVDRCRSNARLLIEALKTNTTVTGIVLRFNSIGVEGVRALADVLKVNTSVTSVYLHGNPIGVEGVSTLAEALKVNTTITSLYLRENCIGFDGTRALAEVLKVSTSVTRIYLRENSIGAEGVSTLAEALKSNTTITSVCLRSNSLRAEGARALAEALKVNISVTSVDLSGNSIGAEGARALAEALKVSTSITSIKL
ncbi:hypothetical protein GEMRC1_005235 [Eukaryota sp. GEM-RC1]